MTRAEQMAEALDIVRGLLGDRDAAKVRVRVTPGGTYEIEAETEGGKVAGHQYSTGRGK